MEHSVNHSILFFSRSFEFDSNLDFSHHFLLPYSPLSSPPHINQSSQHSYTADCCDLRDASTRYFFVNYHNDLCISNLMNRN